MNVRLPKVNEKRKKRLGRGMGSGKGSHTTGRGQKGQKSKGKIHVLFEGMKMKKSLLKRLPLMRGKGKFHSRKKKVYNFKSVKAPEKAAEYGHERTSGERGRTSRRVKASK